MSEKAEYFCLALEETRLALLCEFGDRKEWIPKSQIDEDSEVYSKDDEGVLIIPEWLAIEKGLE